MLFRSGYGADPSAIVQRVMTMVDAGAWAIKGNHDEMACHVPRRGRSRWRHVTSHFIVIAFDRPRARINHRHHSLHDGRWIGAVTDEIPQKRELRSPTRAGIGYASVKRLHVGMNIGEERQFHNAGCVRFEKIIRQPLACAGQSWAFG